MPVIPAELRDIAETQHGLVRRGQALAVVSEPKLRTLLAPGGPAQIVVRGVYAMFTGRLDDTQRRQAAVLFGAEVTGSAEDVMITGAEACRMYGLRQAPLVTTIHVLIRHGRQRSSRGFVIVERTRRTPTPRHLAGFPVAPVARAVIDATRRMRDLDDVRKLMYEAVQRRRVSIQALDKELRDGPVNWSARARLVLLELVNGARSLPENDLIAVLASSTILPPAHHNCALYTDAGEFLGSPDAYLAEVGLAGEVQSLEHHTSPQAQEGDYNRRIRFARFGGEMLEVRPSRLSAQPLAVRADFEAVYSARSEQGITPRIELRCRPECPLQGDASASA